MEKNKFRKIQEKFNNYSIDLEDINHDKVDFINITKDSIKNINRWVREHSDIYKMEKVILYHGTSEKNAITKEGIKRTSLKSKKSLQSAVGFVYLYTQI
jgi:site-specific DNA-adenine methylase